MINEDQYLVPSDEYSCLSFCPTKDEWVMKIEKTENGAIIKFNTEYYPNCVPDDFARAVCEILCRTHYLDKFYEEFKQKGKE